MVLFCHQGIDIQAFFTVIAPVVDAYALVQPFGGGFGEAVCERLQHDCLIVVMGSVKFLEPGLDICCGNGKGANVVWRTHAAR